MKSRSGFALTELMVVVAIIAILAAISLPMYRNYVQRSNWGEVQPCLSDMALRVENHRGNSSDGRYPLEADIAQTTCGNYTTMYFVNGDRSRFLIVASDENDPIANNGLNDIWAVTDSSMSIFHISNSVQSTDGSWEDLPTGYSYAVGGSGTVPD